MQVSTRLCDLVRLSLSLSKGFDNTTLSTTKDAAAGSAFQRSARHNITRRTRNRARL